MILWKTVKGNWCLKIFWGDAFASDLSKGSGGAMKEGFTKPWARLLESKEDVHFIPLSCDWSAIRHTPNWGKITMLFICQLVVRSTLVYFYLKGGIALQSFTYWVGVFIYTSIFDFGKVEVHGLFSTTLQSNICGQWMTLFTKPRRWGVKGGSSFCENFSITWNKNLVDYQFICLFYFNNLPARIIHARSLS